MGTNHAVRALEDPNYDYYRLTQDLGFLRSGTIFYHDTEDSIYGSISEGCLKLCWTADGNCIGSICGGTVIFHAKFKDSNLFVKVKSKVQEKNILLKIVSNLKDQISEVEQYIKDMK